MCTFQFCQNTTIAYSSPVCVEAYVAMCIVAGKFG